MKSSRCYLCGLDKYLTGGKFFEGCALRAIVGFVGCMRICNKLFSVSSFQFQLYWDKN